MEAEHVVYWQALCSDGTAFASTPEQPSPWSAFADLVTLPGGGQVHQSQARLRALLFSFPLSRQGGASHLWLIPDVPVFAFKRYATRPGAGSGWLFTCFGYAQADGDYQLYRLYPGSLSMTLSLPATRLFSPHLGDLPHDQTPLSDTLRRDR